MKPSERLKEIEHDAPLGMHYVKLNNEDTLWLIAKVKRLTEDLKSIERTIERDPTCQCCNHNEATIKGYITDALEGSDE